MASSSPILTNLNQELFTLGQGVGWRSTARKIRLAALRGPSIDEIVGDVRMRMEDKEKAMEGWRRETDGGSHGWQYIQELIFP